MFKKKICQVCRKTIKGIPPIEFENLDFCTYNCLKQHIKKDFKFKIGDIVAHKINKNISMSIIDIYLEPYRYRREKQYKVRWFKNSTNSSLNIANSSGGSGFIGGSSMAIARNTDNTFVTDDFYEEELELVKNKK